MKEVLLYGRHAVLAALDNPRRKINKVLCTKETFEELKNTGHKNLVRVVDKKEIDRLLPPDSVHQGLLAYGQELENYAIEEIIALANEKERCCVLILDQVTDPQNIGAIIRSAVAFDCLALILQDRNAPRESGAMAKAAAGQLEHLPVCRVTNLSRAMEQLKKSGFWTVGMDGRAQTTIDKIDKNGRTAVVMGSEGSGMRRLIEENCDLTAKLPVSPQVESLNVSAAAAITLYELNRA
jgi:23S rRNA (guanosine2251-2'-O)-methyltransferase